MANTNSNVFPFNQVENLEEDSFIAGTHRNYTFTINDENGSPVNLASCQQLTWMLSRYGSPTVVLTKTATYGGTSGNEMYVEIQSSDTVNLKGKYVHQPVIIDASGDEYRPSQGIITIFARIS
jgi:hypothetical protein